MSSVCRVDNEFELTPEEEQAILNHLRDGISYEVDWDTEIDKDLTVLTICWHPGEHNQLALSIIEEVHGRMGLVLDGHKYWIEPQ